MASMTSAASTTSEASMTSTASFHQKKLYFKEKKNLFLMVCYFYYLKKLPKSQNIERKKIF
jgi:hypothetical protein